MHDNTIERKCLCSMILDEEALIIADAELHGKDFYEPSHQLIFNAIQHLFKKNIPRELSAIADKIKKDGDLQAIGGGIYLSDIISSTPSAANINYYVETIKQYSQLRTIQKVSHNAIQQCFKAQNAEEVLPGMLRELVNIYGTNKSIKHISDTLPDTLSEIAEEQALLGKDERYGLCTGLYMLDHLIGGIRPGWQVILAARPGEGKTTFALFMAMAIAQQANVLMFSYEMSISELDGKMLSHKANLNLRKKLDKEDGERLQQAASNLEQYGIYKDDTHPTLDQLETRCRRFNYERKLGLVIIDYLQIMGHIPGKRTMYENITETSRRLKKLALELKCSILILSQLGRETERRASKDVDSDRPKLSDLKESGAIEQDADLVLFLHRDKKLNNDGSVNNKVEVICPKHRHGSIFSDVFMKFDREHNTFYEHDEYMEMIQNDTVPF